VCKGFALLNKDEVKVLFILKQNSYGDYGDYGHYGYGYGARSGLYTSAKLVSDALNHAGIPSKIVCVTDNNNIDKEVFDYKPTVVIIEALWVVPEKFDILKKLHPHVRWVVRIHSEVPFLALEGLAIEWIKGYLSRGVTVAFNSLESSNDFAQPGVTYLPNIYPFVRNTVKLNQNKILRIGCFGAIRPMKNQLLQAMAAIRFADRVGMQMFFHMNTGRIEGWESINILTNIRALFAGSGQYKLVEHDWLKHEMFLELLGTMDIGMQVSMSESFNIVTADMVNVGIPVVVSEAIKWVDPVCQARPSINSIVDTMEDVWENAKIIRYNQWLLELFSNSSLRLWTKFINETNPKR
jgi:hypothetical protein